MNSNRLPANRLRISFDTRVWIQAETTVGFLTVLTRAIRAQDGLGAKARIEIVDVGQGSWWAEILIIAGTLAAGAGVIATSAENLANEIRAGATPFAKAAASVVAEGEASRCEVSTSDLHIEITTSEMKALAGMMPGVNAQGFGPRSITPDIREGAPLYAGHENEPDIYWTPMRGIVRLDEGQMVFIRDDGARARIAPRNGKSELPTETTIEIFAALKWDEPDNDPALMINNWRPIQTSPIADRLKSLVGRFRKVIGGTFEFEDENSGMIIPVGRGEYDGAFPIDEMVLIEGSIPQTGKPMIYVHTVSSVDSLD